MDSLVRIKFLAYHALCRFGIGLYVVRFWDFISKKKYVYTYLEEVDHRGRVLIDFLKPHLRNGDNLLDIMCGYSPVAGPLLNSGYQITGFDNKPEVIKYCKRNYPKGDWVLSSFENLTFKNFSILLFLGVSNFECLEIFFAKSFSNLIKSNNPRLFFLEAYKSDAEMPRLGNPFFNTAAVSHITTLKSYNVALQKLQNCGYKVVGVGEYDAKIINCSERIYAILEKTNSK